MPNLTKTISKVILKWSLISILQASNVDTRNGRPFNQLAILAYSTKRKFEAVYYNMRCLQVRTFLYLFYFPILQARVRHHVLDLGWFDFDLDVPLYRAGRPIIR